eukprot:TRINITY_DN4696_c0_g1_i13.p1 TRINITY_DN4696_c0_g1~~TRINITY_DN4696_c0_g1_i13.p1  ORF type:complete len:190 (+),score=34.81 TRINITY_DN4696_c0_g1_i13:484-1053(+)
MLLYHVFGGFWSLALNVALTEFIIASATIMWYFREKGLSGYVIASVFRAFRFHLGSLVFGSLLLALVWAVRAIFEYFAEKAEEAAPDASGLTRFLITCMRSCLDCFNRLIRFLNRNAYIQIALTGENFCTSARESFFLVLRNSLRYAVTTGLGGIFIMVGRAFIAVLTTVIGYFIITRVSAYSTKIVSP